jgi:hypothetical protein
MSITTVSVEEAHCYICGHDWIIRNPEDRECPECRRRESKITSVRKNRNLCLSCHHIWFTEWLCYDEECPKCHTKNEDHKKAICFDPIQVFICGSCGNEWTQDGLGLEWEDTQIVFGNKALVPKLNYCQKCGCGREEALKERSDALTKARRRQQHGFGISSYRGHTQHIDSETGEWVPSKEEIDAKIATGIWEEHKPLRVRM